MDHDDIECFGFTEEQAVKSSGRITAVIDPLP